MGIRRKHYFNGNLLFKIDQNFIVKKLKEENLTYSVLSFDINSKRNKTIYIFPGDSCQYVYLFL